MGPWTPSGKLKALEGDILGNLSGYDKVCNPDFDWSPLVEFTLKQGNFFNRSPKFPISSI